MIESTYSAAFAVGISAITILISITSIQVNQNMSCWEYLFYMKKMYHCQHWLELQALMNVEHPEMLIRFVCFNIGQVFVLYCNTIPGQRIIDHSIKVQKFACVLTSHVLQIDDKPVKAVTSSTLDTR